MRSFKGIFVAAAAAACFTLAPAQNAQAQVAVGIAIGHEPTCAYGYYDYSPYQCAPRGYYGPEWFNNGVFIGAGNWYHGGDHFYGHVNHDYDPRYGYHYVAPAHDEHFRAYGDHEFRGNGWTNGHGEHHEENWHH